MEGEVGENEKWKRRRKEEGKKIHSLQQQIQNFFKTSQATTASSSRTTQGDHHLIDGPNSRSLSQLRHHEVNELQEERKPRLPPRSEEQEERAQAAEAETEARRERLRRRRRRQRPRRRGASFSLLLSFLEEGQPPDASLPTAAALAFAPGVGRPARSRPFGLGGVRGIPVGPGRTASRTRRPDSSFDLFYFFPVDAWLASGEDSIGFSRRRGEWDTRRAARVREFHFVDFRPDGRGSGRNAEGAREAGSPPRRSTRARSPPAGPGAAARKRSRKAGATAGAAGREGGGSGGGSLPRPAGRAGEALLLRSSSSDGPPPVAGWELRLRPVPGADRGPAGRVRRSRAGQLLCGGGGGEDFGRFDEGNGAAPTSAVTSAA